MQNTKVVPVRTICCVLHTYVSTNIPSTVGIHTPHSHPFPPPYPTLCPCSCCCPCPRLRSRYSVLSPIGIFPAPLTRQRYDPFPQCVPFSTTIRWSAGALIRSLPFLVYLRTFPWPQRLPRAPMPVAFCQSPLAVRSPSAGEKHLTLEMCPASHSTRWT